jgi:hypothetical protein
LITQGRTAEEAASIAGIIVVSIQRESVIQETAEAAETLQVKAG